jgi:hypothetical protein
LGRDIETDRDRDIERDIESERREKRDERRETAALLGLVVGDENITGRGHEVASGSAHLICGKSLELRDVCRRYSRATLPDKTQSVDTTLRVVCLLIVTFDSYDR